MMKKLAGILTSFALAFGLMVPAVAFADGRATVAVEYDGKVVNLEPKIDSDANSLMVSFDVQADVAKYQGYLTVGFQLSNEARGARIAKADVSGSTVTAVVSNGEDSLAFDGSTFRLGTLTVNVDAKLGEGDGTGAKIVVNSLDATDATFAAPVMYTMDTRDDSGTQIDAAARSVPFTLAASAYTGTQVPAGDGGNTGGNTGGQVPPPTTVYEKNPSDVLVGLDQMGNGASFSSGSLATLQNIGADILQKVKDNLNAMLAGQGSMPGFTADQLKSIAEVIQAAGGDLSKVNVTLTPVASKLDADSAQDDIRKLNAKFTGSTLLSIYNLGVKFVASYSTSSTGDIYVTELTNPIEFTLSVPEGSLSTMNAAVGFVHAGEANALGSDSKVTPNIKANTVTFPAQKFSTYAVYGKMKSAVPNPNNYGSLVDTGDTKPLIMLAFAGIVLIASIAVVFSGRRRQNKA